MERRRQKDRQIKKQRQQRQYLRYHISRACLFYSRRKDNSYNCLLYRTLCREEILQMLHTGRIIDDSSDLNANYVYLYLHVGQLHTSMYVPYVVGMDARCTHPYLHEISAASDATVIPTYQVPSRRYGSNAQIAVVVAWLPYSPLEYSSRTVRPVMLVVDVPSGSFYNATLLAALLLPAALPPC
ncbi:hypothetical protein K449DRAFT_422071 [Hypoxylon sp. EC38]|nr:hypothetical protein K449DRAFT_422071 [Hypoxylon sp. EC38]